MQVLQPIEHAALLREHEPLDELLPIDSQRRKVHATGDSDPVRVCRVPAHPVVSCWVVASSEGGDEFSAHVVDDQL
jgi:hypothetical protein